MARMRENKDIEGIMNILRQDLVKNHQGIASVELYKVCLAGTKINIEEYQSEIIRCI